MASSHRGNRVGTMSPYTSGTRFEVVRHCATCEDWVVFDKHDDEPMPGLLGTYEEMGEVADQLEAANATTDTGT
jgi:hypothetical protein